MKGAVRGKKSDFLFLSFFWSGLEMLITISSAFLNKQASKSSAYSVLICTYAASPKNEVFSLIKSTKASPGEENECIYSAVWYPNVQGEISLIQLFLFWYGKEKWWCELVNRELSYLVDQTFNRFRAPSLHSFRVKRPVSPLIWQKGWCLQHT